MIWVSSEQHLRDHNELHHGANGTEAQISMRLKSISADKATMGHIRTTSTKMPLAVGSTQHDSTANMVAKSQKTVKCPHCDKELLTKKGVKNHIQATLSSFV
jgi:hypothetical protein